MTEPFSSRDVVHWFSRGPGVTTVLLHGFTGSSHSFDGLVTGEARRICAISLPGHHPLAPVQPDFAANVAWVCGQMRDAGIGRARLVGYSLGARVALAIAASRPELCEALMLVGVHPGLATEPERRARRDADQRWQSMLRGEGIGRFVEAWEALPLWRTQARLAPATLASQRRVRVAHDPLALAASIATMGLAEMPDLSHALGALEMPVRLVAGAADHKFVGIATELVRRYPRVSLHVIENTGHNVVLEAPHVLGALIWPA